MFAFRLSYIVSFTISFFSLHQRYSLFYVFSVFTLMQFIHIHLFWADVTSDFVSLYATASKSFSLWFFFVFLLSFSWNSSRWWLLGFEVFDTSFVPFVIVVISSCHDSFYFFWRVLRGSPLKQFSMTMSAFPQFFSFCIDHIAVFPGMSNFLHYRQLLESLQFFSYCI